ncbi:MULTISPECIES: hypothetical protein [unclassified Deinococcus]|uniref:hypothetical protein n=1 Tax=unclassified Deinococcus TaxID=2623546 RepID=UPI001C2F447F|nr:MULTISPECIES: hypothetical protein [unclassified Deinococcus]MDK2014354.1 hypothetical protein [Deinococcus sp. 43]
MTTILLTPDWTASPAFVMAQIGDTYGGFDLADTFRLRDALIRHEAITLIVTSSSPAAARIHVTPTHFAVAAYTYAASVTLTPGVRAALLRDLPAPGVVLIAQAQDLDRTAEQLRSALRAAGGPAVNAALRDLTGHLTRAAQLSRHLAAALTPALAGAGSSGPTRGAPGGTSAPPRGARSILDGDGNVDGFRLGALEGDLPERAEL